MERETVIDGRPYLLAGVPDLDGSQLTVAMPLQADLEPLIDALGEHDPDATIHTLVPQLRRIGRWLGAAGLPDAFNGMYTSVSTGALRSVMASRRSDTAVYDRLLHSEYPPFDKPEKVERAAGVFGEFYMDEARRIAAAIHAQDPRLLYGVSPAWLRTLLAPEVQEPHMEGPQAIMGMQAHIKKDLPEVGAIVGFEDDYRLDYEARMRVIFDFTRRDLAPLLVPGPFRHGFKRSLAAPVMKYIDLQRDLAWWQSFELRDAAGLQAGELLTEDKKNKNYTALLEEIEADSIRHIEYTRTLGRCILSLGRGAVPAAIRPQTKRIDWSAHGLAEPA